jgi:hypothetical protein
MNGASLLLAYLPFSHTQKLLYHPFGRSIYFKFTAVVKTYLQMEFQKVCDASSQRVLRTQMFVMFE